MIENITKAPKATLRLMAETTKIIEIVTKILLIKFNEGIIIFCVTVEQSTEIFLQYLLQNFCEVKPMLIYAIFKTLSVSFY